MFKPVRTSLAAISIALLPLAAFSQATEGEMFGFKVGSVLKSYDASELEIEWFGFPYVTKTSEQMAEEFSHLQIIVTPVSGTIMGLRAVADFEVEEPARAFAERLRQALTVQFGPSILCFVEPGAGFENHPCYTIEGASPRFSDFRDINLYQASLSDYDLRLNFYGPSVTGSGEFEVQLAFATAEDTPMYKSVMELFGREAKEFDAAAQDALLERDRGGVLRGIE